MDIGIVAGAVPYLKDTFTGTTAELSVIIAAMMLGGVFSTLFAGLLADWLGRKKLMSICGITFVIAVPMIALSHGFAPLFFGRLLEGIAGGLLGVVVPLYLAECLSAADRGKGTAVFQWLPVSSMVFAALISIYFSYQVMALSKGGDATALFTYKDHAWRDLFWVALFPGILFFFGSLMVSESPRWLFKRGKKEQALAALLRSRSPEQAAKEIEEMEESARKASAVSASGKTVQESLLRRKYVVPFVLACLVLICTQTTGINSIIAYNGPILMQSGLSDLMAHWGLVIFMTMNFLFTMVGMFLVDRKGRKFLLVIGTTGIILTLTAVGILFHRTEKLSLDASAQVRSMVTPNQELTLRFDPAQAAQLLAATGSAQGNQIDANRASMAIIYSYGDFTAATSFVRSDDPAVPSAIWTPRGPPH
jgi:MFS family permease